MYLNYLKKGSVSGDDEYSKKVFAIGDTTDHTIHTRILRDYGIDSEWRQDLDFEDLDNMLEKSIPIPIGILHRGTNSRPTGGHILLVIGKHGDSYIVNDPFGSILDGYTKDVYNGKGLVLSRSIFRDRWLVRKDSNGWGRIIKSIDGKRV